MCDCKNIKLMRGNAYSERTTPFSSFQRYVGIKSSAAPPDASGIFRFQLINDRYAKNWHIDFFDEMSGHVFAQGNEKSSENENFYTTDSNLHCMCGNLFLTKDQLNDALLLIKKPGTMFKYLEKLGFTFEEIPHNGYE